MTKTQKSLAVYPRLKPIHACGQMLPFTSGPARDFLLSVFIRESPKRLWGLRNDRPVPSPDEPPLASAPSRPPSRSSPRRILTIWSPNPHSFCRYAPGAYVSPLPTPASSRLLHHLFHFFSGGRRLSPVALDLFIELLVGPFTGSGVDNPVVFADEFALDLESGRSVPHDSLNRIVCRSRSVVEMRKLGTFIESGLEEVGG